MYTRGIRRCFTVWGRMKGEWGREKGASKASICSSLVFMCLCEKLPHKIMDTITMQNNAYLYLCQLIHCYLKSEELSGYISWNMEPGVSNIIQLILMISWLYSAHNEIITLNKTYELDFFQ